VIKSAESSAASGRITTRVAVSRRFLFTRYRRIGKRVKTLRAAVFLGLALLCFAIHWRAGTYRSEFGRYSDEGMHYVTGLLIHDFAVSGDWRHPMRFATDFYAHFPKVALGNWPPLFEMLQAGWGLLFGVSRNSILILVDLLAVLLALLVLHVAISRLGAFFAACAAALLVASPLTQYLSSMVMAEIPLALFSLLAVLAWIRFQQSARTRDAIIFAVWTVLAIMTKGNGWLIPVVAALAVVLTGSWSLLRNRGLWLAVLIVAAVCLPYTLLTMRIVVQGWDSQSFPGLPYLIASIGAHSRFVAGVVGWPLTLLALAGVATRVLIPLFRVPLFRRAKTDLFWAVLAIYGVVIVLFHALVPTSIEPRKIYQIDPVICLFVAAALEDLAAIWSPRPLLRPALAAAAAAVFAFTGFSLIPPFAPGFAPAIRALLARPDTDRAALLIASNPYFNDFEAALISEWASRRRDSGTYLLRATKILSRTAGAGGSIELVPYDSTPAELRARLASIPVAYVLLDTSPAPVSYRHHELLREALESDPEDWEPVYSARGAALGKPHEIRIFRYRKNVRGAPLRFELDLTRKIHQSIEVGAPHP
jgi:hypothetical protein